MSPGALGVSEQCQHLARMRVPVALEALSEAPSPSRSALGTKASRLVHFFFTCHLWLRVPPRPACSFLCHDSLWFCLPVSLCVCVLLREDLGPFFCHVPLSCFLPPVRSLFHSHADLVAHWLPVLIWSVPFHPRGVFPPSGTRAVPRSRRHIFLLLEGACKMNFEASWV